MNSYKYKTQKDIRGFYLTKELAGKTFPYSSIQAMFGCSNIYREWVIKYVKYHIIDTKNRAALYIIKKCYLIRKDHVEGFINWRQGANHYKETFSITGTDLCIYYDNQSWWKYKENGLDREWLQDDIYPENIKPYIKLRDETIEFLKKVKQSPYTRFRGK